MDPRVDEVIEFWFGPAPSPTSEIFQRWFTKDPAFDEEIRRRFGALHEEAYNDTLRSWHGHARGELALIVVLDQFSRNLYRDDPRAFACDHTALAIARELRRAGRARELSVHQQMVALLPFEHSEDRSTQSEGVAAFTALLGEAKEMRIGDDVVGMLAGALDYAKRHREIIERFGRFPHRNAILGRASTAEELEFLKQPGSSF
ncbi:MAG: DUF924 family protein [Kofleriaceae bacterium]|nr:DUF924 family protein [Kofleriaceae bacterium]